MCTMHVMIVRLLTLAKCICFNKFYIVRVTRACVKHFSSTCPSGRKDERVRSLKYSIAGCFGSCSAQKCSSQNPTWKCSSTSLALHSDLPTNSDAIILADTYSDLHVERDDNNCHSAYVDACKSLLLSQDRTSTIPRPWPCPSLSSAPLPPLMGAMVNPFRSKPSWFNSPGTCAVLPHGVQIGSTCGLHAVCHLLWSAQSLRHQIISYPNRREFEAVGLSFRSGDAHDALIQPEGSNYDIIVLIANMLWSCVWGCRMFFSLIMQTPRKGEERAVLA